MINFEDSLKRLETIVAQLESGELPLDRSVILFEEGMVLATQCRETLEAAETRVQMLINQRDGSIKLEPFPQAE